MEQVMSDLLKKAYEGAYAIPAICVSNMESADHHPVRLFRNGAADDLLL